MPRADFFERLGLFVRRGFLTSELCAELRAETRTAPSGIGSFWRPSLRAGVVDESRQRRKDVASVAVPAMSRVSENLLDLLPALSRHFSVALSGCQPARLFQYRPGDFVGPHTDGHVDPTAPRVVAERRVSAVVFLNSEAAEPRPGAYGGGALTLYGLIDDPRWRPFGFPVVGEEGLLIAFRAGLLHEVRPVSHGVRYVIATWFY